MVGRKLRIVFLGAPATGKTSIIKRFVSDQFSSTYDPTIEDRFETRMLHDGKRQKIEIIDTSGKELIPDMFRRYMSIADGFVCVYSVGNRDSFDYAVQMMRRIIRERKEVPRVLVGSKCDGDYREVRHSEGDHTASCLPTSFAEVSARLNINVHEIFRDLLSQQSFLEECKRKGYQHGEWYTDKSHSFCCFL